MAREKILVVDDEEDILKLLDYNLSKEGYKVMCVSSGEEALSRTDKYDVIILDLMLPGIDGLEVCKKLRSDERTSKVPIVMLTAKGEDADIVAGLELGADDYITKPFSPRVLVARIRNVLRRDKKKGTGTETVIKAHDMFIDPSRHEVLVKGKRIELTATEFGLLSFLARRPGWVFTRNQIIDGVKGAGHSVTDRSVDVQIVGLRKKLGPAGKYIETVHGVGYRFME